jgi:hypothetical protein
MPAVGERKLFALSVVPRLGGILNVERRQSPNL